MLPSPKNFRVTNKDNDPVKLVEVAWDAYTPEEAYGYEILGWRLHRSLSDGFTPSGNGAGEGTCIVDENTLGPEALAHTDLTLPSYGTWFYKLAAVYDEAGGYGTGLYGTAQYGV